MADREDGSVTRGSCPPWCVVDHDDVGVAGAHVSAGVDVPVIQLLGSGGGAETEACATDVTVIRQQRDSDPVPWVYVGDGFRQYLELSAVSWQRLLPVIAEVISRAECQDRGEST